MQDLVPKVKKNVSKKNAESPYIATNDSLLCKVIFKFSGKLFID